MFYKNRHGQVSSIDLMVASIIFVMVFISMRGIWLENVGDAQDNFSFSEMQLKSESALDSLLKTPGYPSNWTSTNAELIGLVDQPLVLSQQKVNNFAAMDYDNAEYLLGLGKYDFNFLLDVPSNHTWNVSAGKSIDANVNSISLKRIVTYRGVKADVVFKVFSK